MVSLTAWATSALLMVPVFMYAATITKESGGENCNIFWPFAEEENDGPDFTEFKHSVLNGQTAFTFYSFVLGFAVPLALILVFYTLVIFKLKTVGPKNKSKEKKKSHRKVSQTPHINALSSCFGYCFRSEGRRADNGVVLSYSIVWIYGRIYCSQKECV